ncbi:mRNA cleavage and polyadenylation factor IA/II complex [Rhizodiscina lignyota]|uniref:Polynucleotide 5'-hydroxyl-kinase GRC3 n=1 Tax=Rhizodiscina lignyota TaxID=1504668 RepID=A0A9P4IL88_9PEZI|nr:mRNA cleavage and polyadenylation factor IA/II complex [Rhizodiscina lignyota]
MSIPGLQLPGLSFNSTGVDTTAQSSLQSAPSIRTQSLSANTEYRFEVPFARTLRIKLLTGTAELFGSELAPGREYTFTGLKGAIFTYHGCELEIYGAVENDYVGEETEMGVAANAHFALDEMRQVTATNSNAIGPRVLVVGPEDCGKTSLMRILTAYAVKMGRQPTVVNLNPREGLLSVPGSLTATTFADILDVEEVGGWGSSPISGPSAVPIKMPLVYHYACGTPDENKAVYKALITRLALAVTSRFQEDDEVRQAGCFLDTPGSISSGKGGSYEMIQHIVSEFSVNVIVVLGSERLYKDMTRLFSAGTSEGDAPVSVVRLAKSEGCVERDELYMRQLRQAQVRNYFFGVPSAPLSPYTQMVDFSQISIYKIKSTSGNSSSFNPGADDDDDDYDPSSFGVSNIYDKVMPSMMLQNALLAITTASATDSQETIRDSSVLGYMYVAEVDEAKKKLRLLSPVSGRVPGNAVVVGDWPEGIMDLMG